MEAMKAQEDKPLRLDESTDKMKVTVAINFLFLDTTNKKFLLGSMIMSFHQESSDDRTY